MSLPEILSGQESRPTYEHVSLKSVEDENGNTAHYMCSPPWANAFSGEQRIDYGPFGIKVGMTGLAKERDEKGSGDFVYAYLFPLSQLNYYNSNIQYPWVAISGCFDHVTPTPTMKADWQKIVERDISGVLRNTSLMQLRNPRQIFSPHLDVTGSFVQHAFHSEQAIIKMASEICAARFEDIIQKSGDKLDINEVKWQAEDFIRDYAKQVLYRYYEMTEAIQGIFSPIPIERHIAQKQIEGPLFEHDLLSYGMNGPFNLSTVWGGVFKGRPFSVSSGMRSEADVISSSTRSQKKGRRSFPYVTDKNSYIDYLINHNNEISQTDRELADRQKSELLILKMIYRVYGHSPHYSYGENSSDRNDRIEAALGDFKQHTDVIQSGIIYNTMHSSDGARNLDRDLDRSVANTSSNSHLLDIFRQRGNEGLQRVLEPLTSDDRTVVYLDIGFNPSAV